MVVDFFIRFELSFWNGLVADVWENSRTSCYWMFEFGGCSCCSGLRRLLVESDGHYGMLVNLFMYSYRILWCKLGEKS